MPPDRAILPSFMTPCVSTSSSSSLSSASLPPTIPNSPNPSSSSRSPPRRIARSLTRAIMRDLQQPISGPSTGRKRKSPSPTRSISYEQYLEEHKRMRRGRTGKARETDRSRRLGSRPLPVEGDEEELSCRVGREREEAQTRSNDVQRPATERGRQGDPSSSEDDSFSAQQHLMQTQAAQFDQLLESEDRYPRRSLITRSWARFVPPAIQFPPRVKLDLGFAEADGINKLPPAFYAGVGIPTMLYLVVDHLSCIPHNLRPELNMTLTGLLQLDYGERLVISVSVSLANGLAIWSRDAIAAHRGPQSDLLPWTSDPETALPGGRYNLPLTVQIPDTRLPPSFETKEGRFAIKYSLTATLSADNPFRPSERMDLGVSTVPFTLLPTIMPDFPVQLRQEATFDWHRCGLMWKGERLTECAAVREEWAFETSLPCTTYSPTQIIPIDLTLYPTQVASARALVFVRVGIKRRQRISNAEDDEMMPPIDDDTEDIISARVGLFEVSGQEPTKLSGIQLPLSSDDDGWSYGYSTHAGRVSYPSVLRKITATNQFFAFVQVGRLPERMPNASEEFQHLPLNKLLPIDAVRYRDFNQTQTKLAHATIPIVIGSVSEPRDAMHYSAWSDLSLTRGPDNVERAHLVEGGSFSNENGWRIPPPAYDDNTSSVQNQIDQVTITILPSPPVLDDNVEETEPEAHNEPVSLNA